MAQATETNPNKRSFRYGQKLQQQAAERIAARPTVTAGLEVSNASQADFDQARARAAATRANAPSTSATSGLQSGAVQASNLSPSEAASFQRQSPGFSQKFPSAPTVENVQARTNGVNPGAAPRAASVADDLVAAGAKVAPAARSGTRAILGRAAVPIAVGMGGYQVLKTAADPNSTGKDVAVKAAEEVGKGATAFLGAKAGAAAGGAIGSVFPGAGTAVGATLGGIGGGLAGYFGGQKLVDRVFGASDELEATAATPAAAKPDFSNVVGGSQSIDVSDAARNQQRQQNGGIDPPATRTGAPDEVLGTFNGRAITRAESDRLSGNQSFGGSKVASVADDLSSYRPPSGGTTSARNPGAQVKERLNDVLDSSTAAGKLYAELSRDKTPTGKRMAAQFLSDYVGAGTTERGQDARLSEADAANAAQAQRGREGDAANIEQQNISARASNRDRPQYVTGDDGEIVRVVDGVMAPYAVQTANLHACQRPKPLPRRALLTRSRKNSRPTTRQSIPMGRSTPIRGPPNTSVAKRRA